MSRFRLSTPLVAVALAVALAAAPAVHAQDASAQHAAASNTVTPLAPAPAATPTASAAELATPLRAIPVAATRASGSTTLLEADAAVRDARAREAGVAIMRQGNARSGKLYMIVGGAAFLAGAIIGDDVGTIIMVGGAGLGIYGIYLYMQ
jgi:hypothetical protein